MALKLKITNKRNKLKINDEEVIKCDLWSNYDCNMVSNRSCRNIYVQGKVKEVKK